MKYLVQFINLEEDDKDLIVSFAIEYEPTIVKSLLLHRTLFLEEFLDEDEKGVKVSMEHEYLKHEDFNTLEDIKINNNAVVIKSTFRVYDLDISRVPKTDREEMVKLLKKQNYDNRFTISFV